MVAVIVLTVGVTMFLETQRLKKGTKRAMVKAVSLTAIGGSLLLAGVEGLQKTAGASGLYCVVGGICIGIYLAWAGASGARDLYREAMEVAQANRERNLARKTYDSASIQEKARYDEEARGWAGDRWEDHWSDQRSLSISYIDSVVLPRKSAS